jgi:diadenosine tetraphosphate (Ap4A) HIT family hydrolase
MEYSTSQLGTALPHRMREDERVEHQCRSCRIVRGIEPGGPGGRIYDDGIWTVEHALEPIPLVGWLVMVPHRHIESVADLNEREAELVGVVLQRTVETLMGILQPEKVYLSMFAEKPGFHHVHIHVIPRFHETPLEYRGPGAFRYMADAAQTGKNNGDIAAAERLVHHLRHALQ